MQVGIPRQGGWVFAASVVIVYLVYSGLVAIPFYHEGSYHYALGGLATSCAHDPAWGALLHQGQPFSAVLDCYNFKVGSTFFGIACLRIACLLGLVLFMGLLTQRLQSIQLTLPLAFFISGSFICLQAVQQGLLLAETPMVVTLLLVLCSDYGLQQKSSFFCLLAMVSLLIAFFTSLPFAAFFLILLLARLLFQSGSVSKKALLRQGLVFVVCSSIFMVSMTVLCKPYWRWIEVFSLPQLLFIVQAAAILIVIKVMDVIPIKQGRVFIVILLLVINSVFANTSVARKVNHDYLAWHFFVIQLSDYLNHTNQKPSRIHVVAQDANVALLVNVAIPTIAKMQSTVIHRCIFADMAETEYFEQEINCIKQAPKNSVVVTYSKPFYPIYISPNTVMVNAGYLEK